MKFRSQLVESLTVALTLVLAGMAVPEVVRAQIPAGNLRIDVADATNHVWDIPRITGLAEPSFSLPEDITVDFSAPFEQTGAGKLVGAGATVLNIESGIYTGPVNGAYVTRGSVTSSKGIARLILSSSAKGTVVIDGRLRTVSAAGALKASIDSVQQFASGTFAAMAGASGYGSVRDAGQLDFVWADAVSAMGSGDWSLHMSLTNDTIKKVGGTASAGLSSGRRLGFTVKGTYTSKTDRTLLVLVPDVESKGSSLKVTLTGTNALVQGKLMGQAIKSVGTVGPDAQ